MYSQSVRAFRCLFLGGAALLFGACADDSPTAPINEANRGPSVQAATLTPVPGRYIVLLRPGQPSAVAAAAQAFPDNVEHSYADAGLVMMRDLSTDQISRLSSMPQVEQVVQDQSLQWIPPVAELFSGLQVANANGPVAQGTDQSSAQFFPFQWNIRQIQAPAAWNATPAGLGKLVCVLDTGVDPGHLDLNGKVDLSKSASMVAAEPFIEDLNLHGTFVSGLISSNGIAIASVASDAQLCAVKVLGASGSGSFGDIINGIIFAALNRVDVINMSLGAYVDRTAAGVPALTDALQRAILIATDAQVLVVASSGNAAINLDEDGRQFAHIPSQLRNVISVGATAPINQQNFDMLASYSNFGGRTGLDMVAPGGDLVAGGTTIDLVLSACSRFTVSFNCSNGITYLFGAGTSFASPLVAGAAAVVESQTGILPAGALSSCVINGSDVVGPARIFGAGRLNVLNSAGC